MKLVFITQDLDPHHPALAQTVDLVRVLATRVDELRVVARRVGALDVPAGTTVRTFDAGSRPARVAAFERALWPALQGADAVLVHMVPEFALLAAPLLRLRRAPLLLWYTHWHGGRALRLATRLCDAALSVDPSSYPIPSPKVRGVGHAIDVAVFDAAPAEPHDGPMRLLALGRTARWKGLRTLLDAVDIAVEGGADLTLEICGPSLTDDEVAYRAELERRIAGDDALRGRAELRPPVSRQDVPALLAAADVVVSPNEPRRGATLDKVVFEAAACARPVISTNPSFGSLLGGLPVELIVRRGDAQALAAALAAVATAAPADRAAVGVELRRRVVAGHSLAHWAECVLFAIGEVRSARGTAGPTRSSAGRG
jgi:glycosyltransferase involved in cell wall biosynthesis